VVNGGKGGLRVTISDIDY